MLALVTGGAGFIGSHLVDRLLADGHEVRIFDDFSTGKMEHLPRHERLAVVRGSVADYKAVETVMEDVDWVFHHAAVASVVRTINDPVGSQRTNYQGTLNILDAGRRNGVRRMVFASSAAVYGDRPELPKTEAMKPRPLSPYAVDKLASEYACQVFRRLYGLETVCLRYFNVYGPRQDPSSPYSGVISVFVDRLVRGLQPVIFGDGAQTRDFVFIQDAVQANIAAVTVDAAAGGTFNIGTGEQVSLLALLRTLCRIMDVPFSPEYAPARQGDIKHSLAQISKAMDILNWEPRIELEQGLHRLLAR